MNSKKLGTSKYYIAYLDILGSKEYIKNEKKNEYLNALNLLSITSEGCNLVSRFAIMELELGDVLR